MVTVADPRLAPELGQAYGQSYIRSFAGAVLLFVTVAA
jgi:hypothetical protein